MKKQRYLQDFLEWGQYLPKLVTLHKINYDNQKRNKNDLDVELNFWHFSLYTVKFKR